MKKNKVKLILLGLFLMALIGVFETSQVRVTKADTAAAINIPTEPPLIAGTAFHEPTDPATTAIQTQPNTSSSTLPGLDPSNSMTSVAVQSGDTLRMYGGTSGSNDYKRIEIVYQLGSSTPVRVNTNSTATFGPNNFNDQNLRFWYDLTFQTVTVPTWNYYQVVLVNTNLLGITQSEEYSQFFRVLVMPANYQINLSPSVLILFEGQSGTIMPTNLDQSIIPSYTTPTGSYVTQSVSGNESILTATNGPGATSQHATFGLSDISVGGESLDPDKTYTSSTTYIYTGRLQDQSVSLGESATFTVEMPPAVDVESVSWTVDGAPPPEDADISGNTMELPNAQADAVIQATVTAKTGASGSTEIVVTSNTAQLTVTGPTEIQLSADPYLFSGEAVAVTTNETQVLTNLPEGTPLTWHVYQPGTQIESPLATVSDTGLVQTTNSGTGSIDVVAEYSGSDGTVTGVITLQILSVPDQTFEAGSTATLTVPTLTLATGQTVAYQWYMQIPDGDMTAITGTNASTYQLTNVQLGQEGTKFRVRYNVTTPGQPPSVTTYGSNVFTLHVTEPGALSLEEAPAFQFGKMGSTSATMISPTIEDMMTGFSGAGTVGDATWMTDTTSGTLKIADTRSTTQPWKLTVGLSTFTNGMTAVNASLQLVDGGTLLPLIETGASTELYPSQVATGGTFEKQLQAYLSTEPSSDASLGSYSADVTWTLEDTPNP
ncbi:WxL domain-containing protein [Lacticaseibacillus mingshuiensis]|uniref:WxL domain-containing protein n=1 Tax=Lacticaseibacillus mingshuiensis TaxID=2799574 RepID=UPI00194EA50B|nr:WxL domain-containing protein [Lacticaseibacillus mingshuiensis]